MAISPSFKAYNFTFLSLSLSLLLSSSAKIFDSVRMAEVLPGQHLCVYIFSSIIPSESLARQGTIVMCF